MNQDRAGADWPLSGLIRECRIRWRLFRRHHRLTRRHLLGLVAGATLVWLGLGLYQNYRSDASLRRQLLDLQYQTQALQGQDRAQSQELGAAGSSAAQAEIARADGLSPAGEQVYVIESPLRASGPGPLEQGIGLVAQSLGGMARSLAPTPTVAGSSPP